MKNKKKNLPEVIEKKQIELAQDAGPMAQVTMFLASGGKFEDVEKMMELQDRFDAKEAKKAYIKSMAEFKKDPPKIIKDTTVDFTGKTGMRTKYDHATLGNVTHAINQGLGEHGFSVSYPLEQDKSLMKVTCIITHELGHSESTFLEAGFDNTGNKNSIQSMGSTISYLERYTVLALTGLATHDQDDDGQTSEVKFIDEKQVSQLTDMINSIENFSIEAFLSWAKLESIGLMPVYDFGKNMNALKSKAGAK